MKKPRRKNMTRYTKICKFCGTDFVCTRSDGLFCCASHKAAYHNGYRWDPETRKVMEAQHRIKLLIREIQKADQAELNKFGDWLQVWLRTFSDKLRTAIANKDLQALSEINIKLSKVVKELELIENE